MPERSEAEQIQQQQTERQRIEQEQIEQEQIERQIKVRRFKYLTETALPARAAEQHWPIRLDHCFKRICLDHAFNDVWYNHLPRPAERHIQGAPLDRALECAESLLRSGRALLGTRNAASLGYRGKRG